MIPMVDLKQQYQTLKQDIDQSLQQVLEQTHFILGPNVKLFEQEAAAYLNAKNAVSCASGTDALHLALLASGIQAGDEVITTPFTFIASAEAICYIGAAPVFVDICSDTFNLDVNQIANAITEKTRAIMPVHLFGQPVDMTVIMALAKEHDLLVIEDCAQSFGASVQGKMTGTIGTTGCFSFFPSKNLGCFGDGGMVTTESNEQAEKLKMLRNHGCKVRYHHDIIGINSRLDELQASILRIKLNHIDEYNTQRRRAANTYTQLLKNIVITPDENEIGSHVYHQYTLLSPQRDKIMQGLAEHEIASAIYYPIPLHRQKVFAEICRGISLPVSEQIAEQCLSLPIYPELQDNQIEMIVDIIKSIAQT